MGIPFEGCFVKPCQISMDIFFQATRGETSETDKNWWEWKQLESSGMGFLGIHCKCAEILVSRVDPQNKSRET